jgi:hypothetical protein
MTKTGAKRKSNFNPVQDHFADVSGSPASAYQDVADARPVSEVQTSFVNASANPDNESVAVDASSPAIQPSSHGPRNKFLRLLEPSAPVQPERHHAVVPVGNPPSPKGNRQSFLNGLLPTRICCNLALCRAPSGSKFNVTGICVAVFPAQSNPDRRYIQMADETGTVGITVWNGNVAKFDASTSGKLVTCVKVAMSSHNGKKMLTMTRDSSIQIADDDQHVVSRWWRSLLHDVPKSCGAVHDVADGSMIAVTGILGFVNSEVKMVNGVEKNLTYLHLVDPTGRLDVRSWNHPADMFLSLRDCPIRIARIRVTSFAGTKICELLDGDASVLETTFAGQTELTDFWSA